MLREIQVGMEKAILWKPTVIVLRPRSPILILVGLVDTPNLASKGQILCGSCPIECI